MQACARVGATHSVVFGGFSAKSLHERIIDAGASAVITADEQVRGGKHLPLKAIVDEALGLGGCEAVGSVIVYQRTGGKIAFSAPRDVWMHELVAKQADTCAPEWVGAEHPLFILYTSGSTGTPKGVQHSSGGYLLWAILTMKWTFDIKLADIFWCTADIGWVTGHTYIAYGPLAVGATEIVFEGVPTFPDAGASGRPCEAKYRSSIPPRRDRSLIKACVPIRKRRQRTTILRRFACWVPWASRSIPRHGCGTTTMWAAVAARSSTRSGRRRRAGT
jgi:acetyl-CoA synthetase